MSSGVDVKTAFRSTLKRASIESFGFHDPRHTFASQLIMRGGTLKDVQEILGHKTMTMTMTLRYAHLTQQQKKKAVNLLNGLTAIKGKSKIDMSHILVLQYSLVSNLLI